MITLKNVTLRRGAKVLLDGARPSPSTPVKKSAWWAVTAPASRRCLPCSMETCTRTRVNTSFRTQWRMGQVAQDMPETDPKRH